MKKILLIIILAMSFSLSYSQETPDLQLLNFEGVSFDAKYNDFAKELKNKLGWEIANKQENGFILKGEYLDKPCLALVEVSPQTKLAYLMHIKLLAEGEGVFTTFARATTRLTSLYGEPDVSRVEGRDDLMLRVWQPPFKGYEILKKTQGIHCGVVMLQLDDDGLWIKIVDSTHKLINDDERGLTNL